MCPQDYFRRDQESGVSAPNPLNVCEPWEHIVKARGKRTNYTSVSLDQNSIRVFGPQLYRLLYTDITSDGHNLMEHQLLVATLTNAARTGDSRTKDLAIRALRYARRRREGLVGWGIDVSGIERKNVITHTYTLIQQYFARM